MSDPPRRVLLAEDNRFLRKAAETTLKRQGYLIFHDLRRSAVRNMERAGVLRTVAMRISGHRSEAVYRRYAIVSTEDVAQAMARTEAYVTEQTADKTRTIQRSGTRK